MILLASQAHMMPQRSTEWFDMRRGKLTASVAGSWIAESPEVRDTIPHIKKRLEENGVIDFPKTAKKEDLLKLAPKLFAKSHTKTTSKAIEEVVNRLIAERLGFVEDDGFDIDMDGPPPRNPALRAIYYGILYEAEALSLLSFDQGLDLLDVGFCEHFSGVAGCSPDSVIDGQNVIVENKVTMYARIQIGRLRAGVLPDCFKDQVHFQMASAGADACWFQSYHPEIEPLQILVKRDDHTEKVAKGINSFAAYFKEQFKAYVEKV